MYSLRYHISATLLKVFQSQQAAKHKSPQTEEVSYSVPVPSIHCIVLLFRLSVESLFMFLLQVPREMLLWLLLLLCRKCPRGKQVEIRSVNIWTRQRNSRLLYLLLNRALIICQVIANGRGEDRQTQS